MQEFQNLCTTLQPKLLEIALNLTFIREVIKKAEKIFLQTTSTETLRRLLCDIPKIDYTDLFVTSLFLDKMQDLCRNSKTCAQLFSQNFLAVTELKVATIPRWK